jgi:L-fucose isomerase-like protein
MNSSTQSNPVKLAVIFVGRRRPGFDMEWGRSVDERVRGWLGGAGFAFLEPAEKVVDEATMRRAVAGFQKEGAEAMLVLQTTMGDGRLAPTLAQLWPDPPVLWATPEKPEGDMISSCSLVGTHVWASTLRQMGHSFELAYGDPDDPETRARVSEAVRLAVTARRLRSVRLGLVGGQAPGFFALSADPFSVHCGLGAQVQMFSLLEFANVVNELSEQAVTEDVAKMKALGLKHKDTSDADLPMASRLYLALRSFLDNELLDAMTIRCWPEIPNTFGQWPYLGIARLLEEGRAIACEGDADGALAAWLGASLGLGRSYLTDWLEHDRETITLWHGGCAPMGLCASPGEPGAPQIARHFNVKKPAVVEATLRENLPITLMRLWRCDGGYRLTAREGQSIRPRRHLMGTNGLARLDQQDPGAWLEELCHQGMPHHLVVFAGHHEALLRRLARLLGVTFV